MFVCMCMCGGYIYLSFIYKDIQVEYMDIISNHQRSIKRNAITHVQNPSSLAERKPLRS